MKTLYEFYVDCGRMGDLEGLFIADPEDVKRIMGEKIYFGEVLGKHSEIVAVMQEKMFVVKSEDQDFITKLEDLLGTSISGFNPFDKFEDEDVDD